MRGKLSYLLHARRARQQTVRQCGDRHGANCNSSDNWQERLCLSTFGPLTHIFPQITMPGRSTQQNLRNFEANSLRLELLAIVNAEFLFDTKNRAVRTRSALSLTAALGHSRSRHWFCLFAAVQKTFSDWPPPAEDYQNSDPWPQRLA